MDREDFVYFDDEFIVLRNIIVSEIFRLSLIIYKNHYKTTTIFDEKNFSTKIMKIQKKKFVVKEFFLSLLAERYFP
jgi:hypothetical protein